MVQQRTLIAMANVELMLTVQVIVVVLLLKMIVASVVVRVLQMTHVTVMVTL